MTGRPASAAKRLGSPRAPGDREPIQALATVTLDPRALDGLGPATMDRLADLVAARLADRPARINSRS